MKTKVYLAPTIEDWNRIVQKALDEECRWVTGSEAKNTTFWDNYKEKTAIFINNQSGRIFYRNKQHAEEEYKNSPDDYELTWLNMHPLSNTKAGDFLFDGTYYRRALSDVQYPENGELGYVVISYPDRDKNSDDLKWAQKMYTLFELERSGYKPLNDSQPEMVELTIDDVAKLKGVDPKFIRIKE
jgi:hypothetical protein